MEKRLDSYKYWLILGRNVRFTAALLLELYALNIDISEIFGLSKAKLKALGLSDRCIKEFLYSRENFVWERVKKELVSNKIEPIFYFESDYPEMLKQIFDPPFILYKKGEADLNSFCIGIVGSRKPSDYGVEITKKLASEIVTSGFTVVSGLALGIDTVAHQTAVNNNGITIAVLGCGLNRIYPSSNLALARKILEKGAIISEFPFDTIPAKQNFPARNRIISGLSHGLLVTEAAENSGSLITALSALNQNREVFAVPGNIFNLNSMGTNNLLKSGAHLVTNTKDIFDEFGISTPEVVAETRKIFGKNDTEKAIIKILEVGPTHIDIITQETSLPQSEISSALTIMEISAKVKHLGNNVYRLNN